MNGVVCSVVVLYDLSYVVWVNSRSVT